MRSSWGVGRGAREVVSGKAEGHLQGATGGLRVTSPFKCRMSSGAQGLNCLVVLDLSLCVPTFYGAFKASSIDS